MNASIEAEFAGVLGGYYLNAASIGPIPARARAAMDAFADLRGSVHVMQDEDFLAPTRRARELCARLVGAEVEEIALGGNTSFGINLAALGSIVPEGSIVLLPEREFPANVYPWMAQRRLVLERLPLNGDGWPDIPRLLERVRDPGVSILALSSVQFDNGYRADLDLIGAACQESDTLFVVDAIQSLGCVPLDVRRTPVDVVAAGGHKWLCGPLGTGFAYVRREVQERLEPVAVGWNAMASSYDLASVLEYEWRFLPDARRYEVGTAPLQDHAGLAASLEVLLEAGVENVRRHVDGLLGPLRGWLGEAPEVRCTTPADAAHRAGILSFVPPDPAAVYRRLRAAGIVSSLREGAVRFAPHLYNAPEEIERVIEVLDEARRGGWR